MLYFSRWKVLLILGVIVAGIVYLLPSILPSSTFASLPGWVPHKSINLGLDLRGGSHLLLEVDTRAVVRERLNAVVDDTRTALREDFIGYTGLAVGADNVVRLTIRDPTQVQAAVTKIQALASPVQTGAFGTAQPDISVEVSGTDLAIRLSEAAAVQRATNAVQQSIEVVRRRIDETGTSEPSIQRQGTGRILVQLPGVDDPDRIKRLLGRTAKLTFQMVDNSVSIADAADDVVDPQCLEARIGSGAHGAVGILRVDHAAGARDQCRKVTAAHWHMQHALPALQRQSAQVGRGMQRTRQARQRHVGPGARLVRGGGEGISRQSLDRRQHARVVNTRAAKFHQQLNAVSRGQGPGFRHFWSANSGLMRSSVASSDRLIRKGVTET